MSYILDPQPSGRPAWSRPRIMVIAALIAAIVLGVATLVLHLGQHPDPLDSVATPGTPGSSTDLTWATVGPWSVPISPTHGPRRTDDGAASGFSHDALGAALAALNITYRLTSDVNPAIAQATLRGQTFGDPDAMLAQLRLQPAISTQAPTEFFYRILTGDPTGDSVLIAIAQRSPDSAMRGGYFTAQRSLRWTDGDWRMAVPMPPPVQATWLPDYQPLGGPHV